MTNTTSSTLPKLEISCTSADCVHDLHCFRSTKRLRSEGLAGACRICHAQLIDWNRVHGRDLADVQHTFDALRQELIRHHFWHAALDETAINHALRKGRRNLAEAAAQRIEKSVGAAEPPRDGRQTPFGGNVLYYAQHATASCCRTCIEYWHAIPSDRPLTIEERGYLTELVMRFVDERMPDLPEGPTHVPPRRRTIGLDP
jgi:hypothetical protein